MKNAHTGTTTPYRTRDDTLYDEDAIHARIAGVNAIVCASGDPINKELIDQLPDSVGIIATYSVGFEHVDVEAARARGIAVTNTPDVLTDATADIAILCLLGAARRAAESDKFLRAGQWERWHSTLLLGTHLGGKRLGIYGMDASAAPSQTAREDLG